MRQRTGEGRGWGESRPTEGEGRARSQEESSAPGKSVVDRVLEARMFNIYC